MLLLFTPLKMLVLYDDGLKLLKASFGVFRLTLYPVKPKKKREPKAPKKKAQKKAAPAKKRALPFELSSYSDALRFAKRASGRLFKTVVVERFDLFVLVASDDPAKTGVLYGASSMAVGILLPLFDELVHLKERSLSVNADFSRTTSSVRIESVVYVRPILMILIGILLIFHLPVRIKKRKKDKAVSVL